MVDERSQLVLILMTDRYCDIQFAVHFASITSRGWARYPVPADQR